MLDVSPAHAKDTAYFGAIWKEQANGGAGALLHFLQSFDLCGFDVRKARALSTMLQAMAAAKEAGLDDATVKDALAFIDWSE